MYHDLTEVNRYVDKYMGILGITIRPRLNVRDNLDMKWLGICRWSDKAPGSSLIEIQKAILSQPRTLERVVAHEMVHHLHFLSLTPADIQLIKLGIRRDGHGRAFIADAARINAVMGANFVNETSDATDTFEENKKPYFILIKKTGRNDQSLGWAWAMRLTPQIRQRIAEQRERGAKLFQITERQWSAGTKIVRYGGYSIPKEGPPLDKLRTIFENEKEHTLT